VIRFFFIGLLYNSGYWIVKAGREKLFTIHCSSYTSLMPVMNMSISLMPMNGTTNPPNP